MMEANLTKRLSLANFFSTFFSHSLAEKTGQFKNPQK
jgi:hypothetical protein